MEEIVRQVGYPPKLYEDSLSEKYKIAWYNYNTFTS